MNIVVAADSNWGIGLNGTQPIVISEDRKHFRSVTGNGTVIYGHRTLLDFPGGKPLKNRRNIILSRNADLTVEGGEVVHSVDDAIAAVADEAPDNVFIIGGDSVYKQFLPYCKKAFVTKVEATPDADTFFPDLDALPEWELYERGEDKEQDGIKYRFDTYINNSI
jgi:dihydrofolate reductase